MTTQMEPGGAQKALLDLAVALRQAGHDVSVWTLYDKADYVPQFERRYGLPILDLKMKAPGRPLYAQVVPFVRGLWRAYRQLRRERFHVVQSFQHYSNILGAPLAALAGVPVRVTSQRTSLRDAPGWLHRLDRWVNNSPLVDRMTSVSEATRRFSIEVEGIRAAKIISIWNGIDVERYAPSDAPRRRAAIRAELGLANTCRVVTTVGRLAPQKGHDQLIAAAVQIRAAIPDVHFLIVGEGPLGDALAAQVREREAAAYIHLLGVRQDVPDILLASDLFVLPSLWEGLPNVVLEAMAAGLAVVATAVDGTPELVLDGQTGSLVPPADPAALAGAVVTLLQSPQEAVRLGAAGRQRAVAHFSRQSNVQAYLDLYTTLWQQKTGRAPTPAVPES